MILAVDVGYTAQGARAAGVLFEHWDSAALHREIAVDIPLVADYVPGEFYRRELPCIEQVLAQVHEPLDCIVIDGYVHLGEPPVAGLGWHLWQRLQCATPVVGVAKSAFPGTPDTAKVHRGGSARPLFVTAAGMPLDEAKRRVAAMHGRYRMPDILKRVDQVSRGL